MQSVASINSPDPLPTPAPDRKDTGSGSFSLMLDAASQQPDNPAPEAGLSSGNESSPAPGKTETRPADDPSAQPKDDSGKVDTSSKSAGDASKTGDATAEKKDSEKGAKQSAEDKGATDAPAVAAPDPAQSVPQTGAVPVVLIALDAPKADGGSTSTGGDSAKAVGAEIAATAGAAASAVPVVTPKSPVEAKSASVSLPSNATATADATKAVASAVPAAKALTEAAKSTVAKDASEPNPKPLAVDKTLPGSASVQPAPVSTDEGKPSNTADSAAIIRLTAKASDPHAPAAASGNQNLDAAVARDVSATAQLSQPASLPEPLHAFASSLNPASAPIQTPAATASAQAVPPTSAAIAVEIATRAKEGSRQFDIRLDPPELGRIDVRLDVGKSGEVNTRLTVDRPETLQLLQNDARGLERALQSAGLKTEDGSLQFSLRQQTPDGSAGQQAQGGTNPSPATVYVDEGEPAASGLDQYQWAARLRGGVDIRV